MTTTPVKVRGGGYGLDAELAKRAAEKYDYEMEDEARWWIEDITGLEIGSDFGEGLRDGVVLCSLVNKIHPGIVKRIENKSKITFKLMENVSAFLKACRVMGVNEHDLFETVDLFELKDLGVVVRCLHALGRAVQKNYPEFNGPTLGVKESNKNERQFTEEQLIQARNTPSQISFGSMRTMERQDVTRANDVTFGADAARGFRRPPPPPPPPSQEKIEMVSRARAAPPSPPYRAQQPVVEPTPAVSWSEPAAPASTAPNWSAQNSWSTPAAAPAPPARQVKSDSVAQLSKAIEKASLSESNSSPSPSPAKSNVSPQTSWRNQASPSPAKPSVSPQTSWRSQASPAPAPAPSPPAPSPPAAKPASPQKPSPIRSGVPGLNSSRSLGDDDGALEEAQEWIEEILNEKFLASFGDSLKDGVMLCQLINTIKPGSVAKIQTSQMPFKQMENITAFLKACRAIGVMEFDLFETVDLFEQKNIGLVVKCLHALGRTVQKNVPEFTGPTLGVKEATVNKRQFSQAQLQEAAGAVPLFGQHGMGAERPHDFDRSASVTFGRDAAFSGLEKKNSSNDVTSGGSISRKTSNVSDSGSEKSSSTHPSPLVKSASKSSTLPTRTVWTS